MDPDANLTEALHLAQRIQREGETANAIDTGDAVHLVELFLALDEWLIKGGFLPARWEQTANDGGGRGNV